MMKNKRGMEMTINTVIALVLALILLAFGIYTIYSKIYKPTEAGSSVITCEARGGTQVAACGVQQCAVCIKLPSSTSKDLVNCCINEIK